MCSCPQGFSGNAFVQCRPIVVQGMYSVSKKKTPFIILLIIFNSFYYQIHRYQTHVIHHHADQIVNAVIIIHKLYAHVCQVSLAVHQIVDPNV